MNYRLNYFYYLPNQQSFNVPLKTFSIPHNMTKEEGFKVISYLVLKCARDYDTYITSPLVMLAVNDVLESYHFIKVKANDNTKDILNVIGGFYDIKNRKNAYGLLDWFDNTVTLDDIINIYTKLNLPISESITSMMILKLQN